MDATLTGLNQTGTRDRAASPRRFLAAFLLPCLLAALFAGFSLEVLYSNREQVGPAEAAQIQHESGGLYGSALFYRPYPYKLALFTAAKPDVAIVGSSRALPFIQEGFAAPEVTLGGAVNEIAEGERLIPEMLAAHKPKLVIFTVDFWWFNAARVAEAGEYSTSDVTSFSLEDLLAPYTWIADGDVKLSRLLKTLVSRPDGPPRIGVWANQVNSGFDANGAKHYGGILTGLVKNPDKNFKQTLNRVRKAGSASKLAVNGEFSEDAWRSLAHIDAMLKGAGVEVRYVMPPIAGAVLAELKQAGDLTLVSTLHQRLQESGVVFYDFTDPASLGAADCEFVDGFHAGFVTYLRILRAMSADLSAAVPGVVKPQVELDRLIAANAGRATLHDEAWSGRETDFLGLGCRK